MSHHYTSPLAAYNSLTDKHLTGYFNNTRIRRHLQRVGLVTRSGRILSEKEYRMNAMRKDHQKYIRECLAQAIFHKVLDMERHHQIEIKRKLENFARKERVQKTKVDRSRRPEEDAIPLFSPRPPTGPKSSYGRNTLHDGEQSDSSESPSSSRPNTAPGNMQRPVRLEPLPASSGGEIRTVPKTTSATQPKTSVLEHDHHFPTGVDKDLLKFISASDQTSGISPYRLPIINNFVTPVPPPPKKSSRNPNTNRSGTSRGRRFRPTTAPHGLDQLSMKDPVRFHKTSVHSNVAITMIYLGKSVRLSHDDIDYKDEIKVFQQHCGGENLCIYKGNLLEGETFQCTSRRHRGFPFSLTFYINGIQVDRLSSCCEYKHRKGARLGGKHGYFRFVNIEGASPCYRCIIAMGLDKKPSPPPKKRKGDPNDEDFGDPKVETMMSKMKSEEQCNEEMQRERSMSATSSAYGADKETPEDKTEAEEDADEELISEHNQTKDDDDDDDDENGDPTKDEYDEDFEVDEGKPDEEVNEEEEAENLMDRKSQLNEDNENDDLDLEMEGKNSSTKPHETSDSEKEERDAYSDTEFEHGEKQDRRKESLISSTSTLYNSTSRDDSDVEERIKGSGHEGAKRTSSRLNNDAETEEQIQTEDSADESSTRSEAGAIGDEKEVIEGAEDSSKKDEILDEEGPSGDANQSSDRVGSRIEHDVKEEVMVPSGKPHEANSVSMEYSEVEDEGDSKSIQEKIAEAIESTEILNAEPEPSDSSTDEEDNLMSTAHEIEEVHAAQNVAEDSVADDFCLEDALGTEDQSMDTDSQTVGPLIKESSMTEMGEANTMDFVTERNAIAVEKTSELIVSELEETTEAVVKQESKLMSMMEDCRKEIFEEQLINQEMAPAEASMEQEIPMEGDTLTNHVESEKEDAVETEEGNPTVHPVPSSDTHNMVARDPFEAAEPVVENEPTEVAAEGKGIVEDLTCDEDAEEESQKTMEDVSQIATEVMENTDVKKENEADKEELSLSKEVPNLLDKEALEEEGLVASLQHKEHIESESFQDLGNAVISSNVNGLIDSNKVGEDDRLIIENVETKDIEFEEVTLDRDGIEMEKESNREVITSKETLENADKDVSSSMCEPFDDKVLEGQASENEIMTEDVIQEDEELVAEVLPSEGGVVCDEPLQKEEGDGEIASVEKNNLILTAMDEGDGDKETTAEAMDTEDKAACDRTRSAQETSMEDALEISLQVHDEMLDIKVNGNDVENKDVPEGAEQAIPSQGDDEQVCLSISPERKEPPLNEVCNREETTTETIPEGGEADAETMKKKKEEESSSAAQETIVEIGFEDKEQEPVKGGTAEETNEVAKEEVHTNGAGDRTSPEAAMNVDEAGHDIIPETEKTDTQTIEIGQQNTTKDACIDEEDSTIVEPVTGEDILPNEEDALTGTKDHESPENLKRLTELDEVSVVEEITPEVLNVVPVAESTVEIGASEEHLKDDEDLIRELTPVTGEISTAVVPDQAIETILDEELMSEEAASQKEETVAETSEEMALTREVTLEEIANEGDKTITKEEVATEVSLESAVSEGSTNQGNEVDEIVKLAELIEDESSECEVVEKSEEKIVETNELVSEDGDVTYIPNGKGPNEGEIDHGKDSDYQRELISEETAAETSVGLSFDNEGNVDAAVPVIETNYEACNNLDVNPEEMLTQAAENMANELCPEGEETTKGTVYNVANEESGEITSWIKEEEEASQVHSNDVPATTGEEGESGTP
ncbi:glutamate-rich protein 3 isoform X1 [Pleurodeles waltl]|uniref:glutamate-rich protein 3 isoform X1 n=1 Tax=Pleurodeles waltl TaxID=8319 RepID=UPI0037093D8E